MDGGYEKLSSTNDVTFSSGKKINNGHVIAKQSADWLETTRKGVNQVT